MLVGLIRHDLHGDLAHANAIADITLKIAKRLRMQCVDRDLGNGLITARELDYTHCSLPMLDNKAATIAALSLVSAAVSSSISAADRSRSPCRRSLTFLSLTSALRVSRQT